MLTFSPPVPLALAAPAVAAGLAYINAKGDLVNDFNTLSTYIASTIRARIRERKDRASLFYILEDAALNPKLADRTFLMFEGRSWTYKQTYDIALKYGTWLKTTYNVKPKEIVAMDFGNSEKFLFIWFGLWAIGARPAFLNYNLVGKPLEHCIRVSTTRLVLVDPQFVGSVTEELKSELPDVEFVIFTPQLEAQAELITAVRSPDEDRSEDKVQNIAILIYTSGTTGLPKPAIVSWMKCIISSNFAHRWKGYGPPDIFYTVSHHIENHLPMLTIPVDAPLPLLRRHPRSPEHPRCRRHHQRRAQI